MNRQPTHPGSILKQDVMPILKEHGISVTQFARDLHISRTVLYDILEEKKPITSNIAVRLGKVLGNGTNIWLRMQQSYDLWIAEKELKEELKKCLFTKLLNNSLRSNTID